MRDDADEIKAGMLEEQERTGGIDIAGWLERSPGLQPDARAELIDFAFWAEQIPEGAELADERWVDEGGVARRALAELRSTLPRRGQVAAAGPLPPPHPRPESKVPWRREAAAAAAARVSTSLERRLEDLSAAIRAALDRFAMLLEQEAALGSERRSLAARLEELFAAQGELAEASRASMGALYGSLPGPAPAEADAEVADVGPEAGADHERAEEESLRDEFARRRRTTAARLRGQSADDTAADRAALLAWIFDLMGRSSYFHRVHIADAAVLLGCAVGLRPDADARQSEVGAARIARERDWFVMEDWSFRPLPNYMEALKRAATALGDPALAERFLTYLAHLEPAEVRACAALLRSDPTEAPLAERGIAASELPPSPEDDLESTLAALGRARALERLARLGLPAESQGGGVPVW